MKQTTRLLALSALVLALMLGVFGAPVLEAPSVASAQGQVPAAPTGLTATRSGASTINLSWNSVSGAVRYQVYSWDAVDLWTRLDGGEPTPHTTTTFSHQNLVADRLYYYQVYAVNSNGDRGPRSNRANEVAGQNAPGRPSLTATPGYQVNVISWPAVPNAASYVLYAWDQSWSQVGGTIAGTSYTHTGLTVGQTYYYEARAVNANGVRGAYSAQVSATVLSTPTVTAPVNLQASLDDQQTTLTWQSPPGAGGTITGYEFRYAMSTAALPATWMDAGNDMTETITGLTNGAQYTFEVRAVSSTGMGPAASVMQTPAAVPDAPVLEAEEGYRLVMLSWEAPANNGAAITQYHIEKLNAQNAWAPLTSLPGSATSYTNSGLSDSSVHTYRIIAENAAGRGSASNSADATTLAQPAQPPGPPTGIEVDDGPGKVTLSWRGPLTTGGSPIIRYEYRYGEGEDAESTTFGRWMSAMMELSVEITGLTPGTEYSFEVRAVNSAGAGMAANSDAAAAEDRTPNATGPTAVPQGVRAILGTHDGTAADEGHESDAQITVSWDALPVADNGGEALDGTEPYELCYKKSTDSAWMRWDSGVSAFTVPASTGGGALWSAVHGADADADLLEPGTTYEYRVRAVNSVVPAGTADTCTHFDGDWSRVVSATTPVVKPNAPTLHPEEGDDTATPPQAAWTLNVNSITIRWTKPTDNGGADITAYEVWVGTTMVADATDLEPTVTNLPASRTELISIGLSPETTYYYRVRARNGSGDMRVGAWSEEVSGTTTVTEAGTPGAPGVPTISVTDTTGDVEVTWTAPTEPGTTPITSYEVQYQRVDDAGTEDAQITADAEDWSDAATGTPTPPTALTWTQMKAPGGSTYLYRVRAVNGSGGGAWAEAAANTDIAARDPAAPMLTATAVGSTEIMLQWTKPEDNGTPITGFAIQQWDPDPDDDPATDEGEWTTASLLPDADDPDGTRTTNTPALTVHIVTDLDAGMKYYFRIQALPGGTWSTDDDTMEGAASATTMAGTPAMPVIMAAQTTDEEDESITVTWEEAPSSGGSDILGYQIRVWDGSEWAMESDLAATATMYKDEGLAPGTRYYYILAARNSMGYGPWSKSATAMTAAGNPDAPMLNAVATSGTSIKLTWNVPDANGATITSYQLVRWDGSADAWGDVNLLTGAALADTDAETVTEFEDTELAAGTKYYYRIRALPQLDADGAADVDAGWSATNMSDATSATTHGDTPGRPAWAAGDFTPTASSLVLTWEAPDSGGSAITGYKLQIWSGGRWVDEATLGVVLTYTDMNLAAGAKYYYRVRAINSQGEGLWSATKAGTTTAGSPDAPMLMAEATGMTTVRLTWNVPNYNGADVTEYELVKWDPDPDDDLSTTAGAWGTDNLLGDTAADTVGLTLFVDSNLMPGVTYYYRIRVQPQTGDAGWSTIKSATTDPGAPGRSETVTAMADGQNAIDITWTAAPANGSAIVRYQLQVWDAANSMWMTVRSDLPSTRLSFKHSGLTADTRYVYRVRGVNRAADNNGLGKWSVITFANTAK